MSGLVEPRLRRLVADCLGVDAKELVPNVALEEDLAADSLDLTELVLAVEQEFDIAIPERVIDRIRTYGDLLGTTLALCRDRRVMEVADRTADILIWAHLVAPEDRPNGPLDRSGYLTPYDAEVVAQDALRAGQGARLELTVPPTTSEDDVDGIRRRFAWLGRRGIVVSVSRDERVERSLVRREAAA